MTEIVTASANKGNDGGDGTPLGEIDVIAWYLNKVPETHDLLKCCHQLCYGDYGTKVERKENISSFKGLNTSEKDKVKSILSESPWNVMCLKDLCKFFDLDVKGDDKDGIVTKIVSFLLKPKSTDMTSIQKLENSQKPKTKPKKTKQSPKKKKSSSKSSRKRKKKDSPKKKKKKKNKKAKKEKKDGEKKSTSQSPPKRKARPPIVFYAIEQKVSLKEKHPDMDKRALSKLVMEGWNGMSAEEKLKWEKKSEEERKRIEEEDAVMDLF